MYRKFSDLLGLAFHTFGSRFHFAPSFQFRFAAEQYSQTTKHFKCPQCSYIFRGNVGHVTTLWAGLDTKYQLRSLCLNAFNCQTRRRIARNGNFQTWSQPTPRSRVCILICPVLSPDATQERRGRAAGGGGAAARHCSFPKWSWGEGADGESHSWNFPPHFRIYCLLLERQITCLLSGESMFKLASEVLKRYIILLFSVCTILCCYPAYSALLIFL